MVIEKGDFYTLIIEGMIFHLLLYGHIEMSKEQLKGHLKRLKRLHDEARK